MCQLLRAQGLQRVHGHDRPLLPATGQHGDDVTALMAMGLPRSSRSCSCSSSSSATSSRASCGRGSSERRPGAQHDDVPTRVARRGGRGLRPRRARAQSRPGRRWSCPRMRSRRPRRGTGSAFPTAEQAPRLRWVQLDTSGADHAPAQPAVGARRGHGDVARRRLPASDGRVRRRDGARLRAPAAARGARACRARVAHRRRALGALRPAAPARLADGDRRLRPARPRHRARRAGVRHRRRRRAPRRRPRLRRRGARGGLDHRRPARRGARERGLDRRLRPGHAGDARADRRGAARVREARRAPDRRLARRRGRAGGAAGRALRLPALRAPRSTCSRTSRCRPPRRCGTTSGSCSPRTSRGSPPTTPTRSARSSRTISRATWRACRCAT